MLLPASQRTVDEDEAERAVKVAITMVMRGAGRAEPDYDASPLKVVPGVTVDAANETEVSLVMVGGRAR